MTENSKNNNNNYTAAEDKHQEQISVNQLDNSVRLTAFDLAELLRSKLELEVKWDDTRYKVRCPGHDDHDPSCNFSDGEKGITVYCFACEAKGITQEDYLQQFCAKLVIYPAQLFYAEQPEARKEDEEPRKRKRRKSDSTKVTATYDYCRAAGTLLHRMLRYETQDGKKRFHAGRLDSDGNRISGLNGVKRGPYCL